MAVGDGGVGDVELGGQDIEEAEGGPRVFEAADRAEGDGGGDDVAEGRQPVGIQEEEGGDEFGIDRIAGVRAEGAAAAAVEERVRVGMPAAEEKHLRMRSRHRRSWRWRRRGERHSRGRREGD